MVNKENNSKKTIALQLDNELYNKINKIAQNEDRSLSSLIRTALKQYLNTKDIK